jgi:hypothetical protein
MSEDKFGIEESGLKGVLGGTRRFEAYKDGLHKDTEWLKAVDGYRNRDLQTMDTKPADFIRDNASEMVGSFIDVISDLNKVGDNDGIKERVKALRVVRGVVGDEPFITHLREGENVDGFLEGLDRSYGQREALTDRAKALLEKALKLFKQN